MHGLNFYALHLTRIVHALDEYTLHGSMAPLSEAIRGCSKTIEKAHTSSDADYIDVVVDNETELVENHLGSAFVTCQTFITSVVSRVKSLHEYYERDKGGRLAATRYSKVAILSFGSASVGGSAFSQVQVIDAFANYFKHRDEWRLPWSTLDGQSAKTVAIIQAAGARESSTGNMRAGAVAIGNPSFDDLAKLASTVDAWKSNVHAAYQTELKTLGLVP